MIRRGGQLLLAGLALVTLAGCFGAGRPEKGQVSALWLGAESAPVDGAELARLEAQGIGELFVETARLEGSLAAPRLAELRRLVPARRLPATLVVVGDWPGGEADAGRAARGLAAEIQRLRVGAEQAGLLPVGVHFDVVVAPAALAAYGEALAALRDQLDGRLYLSATVSRRALGLEDLRAVARGVDFLVCFLYGQRRGEREDPDAWDLQSVEGNVQKLERLGRPYLLGASTLGWASWLDGDGREKARTLEADLRDLIADRRLELKPGFSLEGVDRQTFEFVARRPVAVVGWSLAAGDSVRVVKTATPYVEEYLRRTGAWESRSRLGDLFFRAPAAAERLSLSLGSLEVALAPDPATPRLDLRLERPYAAANLWRVRLRLVNLSPEPTDLAFFDANYVSLAVTGATIGEVEIGDFYRFDLAAGGRHDTMQALRAPDTVRLYAPLVEGTQTVESGEIEIRFQGGTPTLVVAGSFLLPEGRLLAIEPLEWSFEEP